MNGITIEVLKEKDIPEYSALMVEVMEEFNQEDINDFQYWFTSIEGIKTRREWNTSEEKLEVVQFAAKFDEKIIGALEFECHNQIQSFFIKKEFQKKGLGRMMFNYAITFFRKFGIKITSITVLSSRYAVNFYKSLGFTGNGTWLNFKDETIRFELLDLFYILGKKLRRIKYYSRRLISHIKIKQALTPVYN